MNIQNKETLNNNMVLSTYIKCFIISSLIKIYFQYLLISLNNKRTLSTNGKNQIYFSHSSEVTKIILEYIKVMKAQVSFLATLPWHTSFSLARLGLQIEVLPFLEHSIYLMTRYPSAMTKWGVAGRCQFLEQGWVRESLILMRVRKQKAMDH